MKNYILEAHRGVSSDYPESTMAAFCAAVRLGYGMIELDPRFTADGRCVILHDSTVNRTGRNDDGSAVPDGTFIGALTLEEAKRLDFGIAFGERFKGERIVTLEEVLRFSLDEKIPLKFDNVIQSYPEERQDCIFDTVDNTGATANVGFTASSFDYIRRVLARFPAIQLHYDGVLSDETAEILSALVPKEQLTVWLRFDNEYTAWNQTPAVSDALSDMAHKIGRLGVWLLDKPCQLEKALGFHADIIETDGSIRPVPDKAD